MRNVRQFALRAPLCVALSLYLCGYSLAVGKISVDPNVGRAATPKAEAQPDPRLAQRVTYEAKYRTVHQIADDLSRITGIKLYAGSNDHQWQVRSRRMNIFVEDVKMADLMNSIAHTMKFAWSCNYDSSPPTYRLLLDPKAVAAADAQRLAAEKKREALWQERRKEWIDAITEYGTESLSELESLRDTDPIVYDYARRGALQAIRALFVEVPETKDRYAVGRSFRIDADELSWKTKSLLFDAGNELWRYLQLSRQDEAVGYGDILRLDDKFDIACNRLDAGGFTPSLRWGFASVGSTGYFHIMKDGRDFEIADLPRRDLDWERFRSIAHNRILDGIDPNQAWASADDHHAKLTEDLKRQEELLYPSEPLKEHTDFDELKETVKLKIETPKAEQNPELAVNNHIASFQKALADATGLGVVADSWVNIEGAGLPDQEATLSDVLDRFSTQFNYNWDKSSTILEFRHRKWWKNRLNQISDDWVARWNENTRKNGFLSLDDLAQISTLNYDQAEESLKADEILGTAGIYRQILSILDTNGMLHWLRLYSTLNSQQRTYLVDRWVSGANLSFDQWKLAQVMFDRIGSLRSDALFSLRLIPSDNDLVYEFREFEVAALRSDGAAREDRKWVLTLPRYVAPKNQEGAAR